MPTTIPSITSSTRPGSPSTGDAYFETDTQNYIISNGSNWYVYNYDDTTAFSNNLSLSFDGSNDYVATNYKPSSSATALSISYWMKSTSYSGGAAAFSVEGYPDTEKSFRFNFTPTGTFYVTVSNGSASYNNTTESATNSPTQGINLFDGSWHHVLGTLNGQSVKVYVDGVEEFTLTSTVTYAGGDQTYPYYIGMLGNGYPSYYWNGELDEVSVFETELSSSDVTAIYNSGVPTDLTSYSPVGWWRMGDNDGGTGTTITDQGSGGNNGTLINMASPNGFVTDVPT